MRTRTDQNGHEERQQTASACDCAAKHNASRSDAASTRRILIVGAGKVGQTLARHLQARGGCEVVGFVDEPAGEAEFPLLCDVCGMGGEWPVLGTRADTSALVERHAIDEVILAHAPTWQQRLAETLAHEQPQVRVRVVPSLYEASLRIGQVESVGDVALVSLSTRWTRGRAAAKRIADVTVSLFGLIALAPVALLVAALIKLTSAGPALFAQERIGLHGKPFQLYKFRTMIQEAEAASGPTLSVGMQDARLTRLGRLLRLYRIDEIPQLWNVLKGEMSLVGPRPERPFFVQKYVEHTPSYALRHQVRPGITGMAQVHGGYHTDARDKLRFDLIYVSHGNVWMDALILLQTIKVCVWPDQATHAAPSQPANASPHAVSPVGEERLSAESLETSGYVSLTAVVSGEAFALPVSPASAVKTTGIGAGSRDSEAAGRAGRDVC